MAFGRRFVSTTALVALGVAGGSLRPADANGTEGQGRPTIVAQDAGLEERLSFLGLAPDRRFAATLDESVPALRIWDVALGSVRYHWRLPAPLRRFAFSFDSRFATAQVADDLLLWDLATGEPRDVPRIEEAMSGVVNLGFAPEGAAFSAIVYARQAPPNDRTGVCRALVWDLSSPAFGPAGPELGDCTRGEIQVSDDRTRMAVKTDAGLEVRDVGSGAVLLSSAFDFANRPWGAMDPTGAFLAGRGRNGTVGLFDVTRGLQVATLEDHEAAADHQRGIELLAFSPDGRTLVTAGGSGWLRAWDPATGELRWETNADRALTGSLRGEARKPWEEAYAQESYYDSEEQEDVRVWNGHVPFEPGHLVFSPNGRILLEHGINRWNTENGRQVSRISAIPSPRSDLGIAAGGARIVELGSCPHVLLRGAESPTVAPCPLPAVFPVIDAWWGAEGRLRLWGTPQGTPQLLTADLGHGPPTIAATPPLPASIGATFRSPDLRTLVATRSGAGGLTVSFTDLETTAVREVTVPGFAGRVVDLVFATDGTTVTALLAADGDPAALPACVNEATPFARFQVRQWNLAGSTDPVALEVVVAPVAENDDVLEPDADWAVDPGGSIVALSANPTTIDIWDLRRREWRSTVDVGAGGSGMRLSAGGRLLLLFREDKPVFYDLERGGVWPAEAEFPVPPGGLDAQDANRLSFSPDGRLLAVAGEDGKVEVWSIDEQQRVAQLEGSTARVQRVVFSADGKTLLGTDASGTLWIWDPVAGVVRGSLAAARRLLAVRSDGVAALVRGEANDLLLVRLADLARMHVVVGRQPDGTPGLVAFTDEGRWDATVSSPGWEGLVLVRDGGDAREAPLLPPSLSPDASLPRSDGMLREFFAGESPSGTGAEGRP